MAKPIEIESTEQFNSVLKESRIVVADCKSLPLAGNSTSPSSLDAVFETCIAHFGLGHGDTTPALHLSVITVPL